MPDTRNVAAKLKYNSSQCNNIISKTTTTRTTTTTTTTKATIFNATI
jgi:hypothetical protein